MHTRKFNRFDDVGNLILGLCESVGSVSMAATVAGYLPDFGIAAGLADILYVCAWKRDRLKDSSHIIEDIEDDEGNSAPLKKHNPLLMIAKFGAGLFSLVEGIEHYYAFALGAPGCGLLPIALAIRSGVDLVCAIETVCYENNDSMGDGKTRAAVVDLIKKAVAFTGWCLVATGNPLGWVFLVASAALSFVAKAEPLGGHGFFSSGKRTQSNFFPDESSTLLNANQYVPYTNQS